MKISACTSGTVTKEPESVNRGGGRCSAKSESGRVKYVAAAKVASYHSFLLPPRTTAVYFIPYKTSSILATLFHVLSTLSLKPCPPRNDQQTTLSPSSNSPEHPNQHRRPPPPRLPQTTHHASVHVQKSLLKNAKRPVHTATVSPPRTPEIGGKPSFLTLSVA